ncbi:MAG TPA: hypothetical protein PLG75_01295 [Methanoculleus sp.]|nr:hypothetical protein [Methanoculleus sp.]
MTTIRSWVPSGTVRLAVGIGRATDDVLLAESSTVTLTFFSTPESAGTIPSGRDSRTAVIPIRK